MKIIGGYTVQLGLFACHFSEVKNNVIAVNTMDADSVFSAVGLRLVAGLFLLTHVLQICEKKKERNMLLRIYILFPDETKHNYLPKSVWESYKYKHSRLIYRHYALSLMGEHFGHSKTLSPL